MTNGDIWLTTYPKTSWMHMWDVFEQYSQKKSAKYWDARHVGTWNRTPCGVGICDCKPNVYHQTMRQYAYKLKAGGKEAEKGSWTKKPSSSDAEFMLIFWDYERCRVIGTPSDRAIAYQHVWFMYLQ